MKSFAHRRLGALSIAALLVSAHYGLGFLLGTAEQALDLDTAGSLYAVSLSLGLLALLFLARFYWQEVEQIWTLLGDRYGQCVKALIGLMSWASLIGIEAVQLISGAAILQVLHVPPVPAMVGIAIVATLLSLLPLHRASRVFQGLLVLNVMALLFSLWQLHGVSDYLRSPLSFVPDLTMLNPGQTIGFTLATIFLVLIDMKCQQPLVQAKDERSLYQGCLLASAVLFLLAFLPTAVVMAGREAGILPTTLDSKSVIPYLLTWAGGGATQPLGIVLLLALLVPALGVSSSILRVQTKSLLDLKILPAVCQHPVPIASLNALLGLVVALQGGSIIGLIMRFYAAYVAAVWVPFAVYLLARSGRYEFSSLSVRLSLISGSVAALTALVVTTIAPAIVPLYPELTIALFGFGFALAGLLLGQMLQPGQFPHQVRSGL